jgi:NAD(P)-dependent dehydrogenase (short-subunit alcohol dehydrogenase family)
MPGLAGKVAVVTGGGSGIGEATAKLLAGSGVSVVVGDVNVPGGERVAAEIIADGGLAIFERCDVSTERDAVALVQRAVSSFGSLHLSANVAGVPQTFSPLTDTKLEDSNATTGSTNAECSSVCVHRLARCSQTVAERSLTSPRSLLFARSTA